jgi:hypothetical protein
VLLLLRHGEADQLKKLQKISELRNNVEKELKGSPLCLKIQCKQSELFVALVYLDVATVSLSYLPLLLSVRHGQVELQSKLQSLEALLPKNPPTRRSRLKRQPIVLAVKG